MGCLVLQLALLHQCNELKPCISSCEKLDQIYPLRLCLYECVKMQQDPTLMILTSPNFSPHYRS